MTDAQQELRENIKHLRCVSVINGELAEYVVELPDAQVDSLIDLITANRTALLDAVEGALPELLVNTKRESDADWFYGSGYNAGLDAVRTALATLREQNLGGLERSGEPAK